MNKNYILVDNNTISYLKGFNNPNLTVFCTEKKLTISIHTDEAIVLY